jgi:hypothetical protein
MGALTSANPQELNLRRETQQLHQQFYRCVKMANVCQNIQHAYSYTSNLEEILKFKKVPKVLKSKLHVTWLIT